MYPTPSLEIEYKGTKKMWDSIVKISRNNGAMQAYTDCGWNENINITVNTSDNEMLIYNPR
ncbi:MAG: hypothetical protein J6J60_04290 [Clostridia bacterium]|nr:hypothetical protein [Clostridia bacterium]